MRDEVDLTEYFAPRGRAVGTWEADSVTVARYCATVPEPHHSTAFEGKVGVWT